MQRELLETARARREANSIRGATKEQFLAQLEAGGGFIYSGFCGRTALRGGDQGADQGHDPGAARRGVPVAGGARDLHVVRKAQRDGGGVGEGVLSPAAPADSPLYADAGLERRGGSLHFGGVALTAIADAVGTPAYVYNAGVIRRQFRALDQALAPVPHRIGVRGEGQRQPRRAPDPARPRRRCRHRLRRRAGPGPRRRLRAGTHRLQRGGEDGPGAHCRGGGRDRARAPGVHRRAGRAGKDRGAARADRCGSASGSIPTSPRTPIPTSPPARAGSSSACRSIRWCRSPSRIRQHRAAHAGHRRDAHREPAAGRRALCAKASAASWTWWRRSATPGSTRSRTLDIGGGLGIRYRDERPLESGRRWPPRWCRWCGTAG